MSNDTVMNQPLFSSGTFPYHHTNNRVPSLAILASAALQRHPEEQHARKHIPLADATSFTAQPTVLSSNETPAIDKIKRKGSRKSKKRASLEPMTPGLSSRPGRKSLLEKSTLSTDQVQSEINTIDTILKQLNTGDYKVSNLGTLAQLTDGATYCQASTMSGDLADIAPNTSAKSHGAVNRLESVSSNYSYDSRLDSTSSDSCSSTESSDEGFGIGKQQEIRDEEQGYREKLDSSYVKTKGEICYMDLPLVEKCEVPFPKNGRVIPIATVSHYAEKLLILNSLPDTPAIDEGTVLWTEGKTSISKVFETFGPVKRPFYSVRINSMDDLPSLGVALGDTVYIVPDNPMLTKYAFPQELMKHKGSDASWRDDNEVPSKLQDYSDDEHEQKAPRIRPKDRRNRKTNQLQSERREQLRGVVRQPSVKYTKDPHMQQYFQRGLRAAAMPDQLFRATIKSRFRIESMDVWYYNDDGGPRNSNSNHIRDCLIHPGDAFVAFLNLHKPLPHSRPSPHPLNGCIQPIPPLLHTSHTAPSLRPMAGTAQSYHPFMSPGQVHSTTPYYFSPAFHPITQPQWEPRPPPPPLPPLLPPPLPPPPPY